MRDIDIRKALRPQLLQLHANDPGTLIVEELGLCQGAARVDIAVINGDLNGIEIKSDRDSLDRLPNQVKLYGQVLDFARIVVGQGYRDKIANHVPDWWGITCATSSDGEVALEEVRPQRRNSKVDAFSVAQLLWRSEALALLSSRQLDKGIRTKRKWVLWEKLAESLDARDLAAEVRHSLKIRADWRSDLLRVPDDGWSQPSARS